MGRETEKRREEMYMNMMCMNVIHSQEYVSEQPRAVSKEKPSCLINGNSTNLLPVIHPNKELQRAATGGDCTARCLPASLHESGISPEHRAATPGFLLLFSEVIFS